MTIGSTDIFLGIWRSMDMHKAVHIPRAIVLAGKTWESLTLSPLAIPKALHNQEVKARAEL